MTPFVLLKNYDHYLIRNDDADFIVGRVYPLNGLQAPYKVIAVIGPMGRETTDAGVVNSLDDAIPTFLAYYEKYPLRWDWVHDEYWKTTLYVSFRVMQDQQGYWLAYRDNYPLLRDGKPARFATATEAQRAADGHELDLFSNAKAIDDGFSWEPDPEIDWRSVRHIAEERANWQRSASGYLL